MPYCPNCGSQVSEEDEKCPNCGAELVKQVVKVVKIGGLNWGKFFTDLVMKPKEAFHEIIEKNIWWLPLLILILAGLFGAIAVPIDYHGFPGGAVARLFFYVLFVPFLFWLFETGALKLLGTLFKGKDISFNALALGVGVAWIAYLPYLLLALIPSMVTDIIFMIVFLLFHIYLLTGLLDETEGLNLGPALIVSIIPWLYLVILTLLKSGNFGIFPV